MSAMKFLVFSLGVLILLVLVCLGAVWLERRFPGKRFDERQKIARGNAYRLSQQELAVRLGVSRQTINEYI